MRGSVDIGAEEAPLARLGFPFLGSIELAANDIDGNAHAPLRSVCARSRVALACVDERLDVGTIEVGAHDAHTLSVAPVQLSSCRFDLELLRSERAPRR